MYSLTSVIQRAPYVCFTQMNPEEIVLLNSEDENFYHLNQSGVDLWLSLETPKQVSELVHVLSEKYCGDSKKYEQDVIEWIEDSFSKGLLFVDSEQLA